MHKLCKNYEILLHEKPCSNRAVLLKKSLEGHLHLPRCSHRSRTSLQHVTGVHFLYFNHASNEAALGPDGYHMLQAPPLPWKHRLWHSGSITFHRDILFDEDSTCRETILDVAESAESCSVTIERVIRQNNLHCITENRCLVYLRKSRLPRYIKAPAVFDFGYMFHPTATLLFRFSALTFNSHRIHFDSTYTQEIEKYPTVLVQGSLGVILLLNMLRRALPGEVLYEHCQYRMIQPCYAGEALRLRGRAIDVRSKYVLWIEGEKGDLRLKLTVTLRANAAISSAHMIGPQV